MLEAAGRYGLGAKKPYQHELRENLLHKEVSDTKEMLNQRKETLSRNARLNQTREIEDDVHSEIHNGD